MVPGQATDSGGDRRDVQKVLSGDGVDVYSAHPCCDNLGDPQWGRCCQPRRNRYSVPCLCTAQYLYLGLFSGSLQINKHYIDKKRAYANYVRGAF